LRDRIRLLIAVFATLAVTAAGLAPIGTRAAVAPPKVVIIVGPTGSLTGSYRSQGDDVAAAATGAGASVVKVYSPNATWANVRTAVEGANIIVYLGHGNGFPNPYNSTLYPDRNDGWGLNISPGGGDSETNMIYCGEGPLTGAGASSWASPQKTYCSGGPITPAPGFVMIYSDACYAPGASEPQNPVATPAEALARVGYFSRPMIGPLRASAYFATDNGADTLVSAILANPDTSYGDLYVNNMPAGASAVAYPHPLLSGEQAWIGKTSFGPVYTYAFAGAPARTFNGGTATYQSPPAASTVDVTRFAGADRYATAAALSAASFAPGVDVAYVATGLKFPDALAGGAAAAARHAPVLLVAADSVPAATAAELTRLQAKTIIVLGSSATVSAGVEASLQAYATSGTVRRLAGADRYGTAAAVSADTFAPGVPVAYIATGTKFPDALAGVPAAGSSGGPMLLVSEAGIPAATATELQRLKPARIVVLGSSATVSSAIASALSAYTTGSVARLAGPDRFATAAAISAANFTTADTVYIATGLNFPDALAGGPVAVLGDHPLLLVTPTSLPSAAATELARLHPSSVVVLGGTPSVGPSVVTAIQSLLAGG
jgi:putative cell wall-binding protein